MNDDSNNINEKRRFLGITGRGWGIIGAIVGILAAIFFIRRRKG
jgi:hypothetical protein